MTAWGRFRGAAAALALAALVGAWWWSTRAPPPPPPREEAIFRFEKDQLVSFAVERPDGDLAFVRDGDRWRVVGEDWRPSSSMVRRVAHQLHDLTSRARVADATDDPARYGLGPEAIRVRVGLSDGRELAFLVGDPNPTSVSWYLQPLAPGEGEGAGPVYVVKKAAVDYYRLDREQFREDRYAFLDAADCDRVEARVGGRELDFVRGPDDSWELRAPVRWSADRDQVRRILGSIAASRALAFVADDPGDLTPWGLGADADRVVVHLGSGEPVSLRFGDPVPGSDPPQRYVYREEDRAVVAARASVAEPLELPLEQYRNPRVVGRHEWDLTSLTVTRGADVVTIHRSADAWRWEGGAPIPGSTPARLAQAAADLRAAAFHDAPPPAAGLDAPWATVDLAFADGGVHLALGAELPEPVAGPDGPAMRRRYASVGGRTDVLEVDVTLAERVEDLLREHARWVDREAQRR